MIALQNALPIAWARTARHGGLGVEDDDAYEHMPQAVEHDLRGARACPADLKDGPTERVRSLPFQRRREWQTTCVPWRTVGTREFALSGALGGLSIQS